MTIPQGDGYVIRFRFGPVFHELGRRGFDRLVDHELGHVVDFALLDDGLRARLDAGIPPGQPCPAGTRSGSCAPREERFAESFAKWASGDLGIALYAGYAVPPPPGPRGLGRAARRRGAAAGLARRRKRAGQVAARHHRRPRRARATRPAARARPRSASAVSGGASGSAWAAWTRSAPAWRSALRSTRATSRSPSRNGST